jgi:hypothetical protein
MTELEWESEVIEIDTDIIVPGVSKKTIHTVTDMLIKKPRTIVVTDGRGKNLWVLLDLSEEV